MKKNLEIQWKFFLLPGGHFLSLLLSSIRRTNWRRKVVKRVDKEVEHIQQCLNQKLEDKNDFHSQVD